MNKETKEFVMVFKSAGSFILLFLPYLIMGSPIYFAAVLKNWAMLWFLPISLIAGTLLMQSISIIKG